MELTLNQTNKTKSIAILMMLCIHLFNTQNYNGLFTPTIFIGDKPFIYYFSMFCDSALPIDCFCGGYGLYIYYQKDKISYVHKNFIRLFKLYINYWIILLLIPVGYGLYLGTNSNYPSTFLNFILNFFAINTTYCGAWWFMTTYVLMVLISPFVFHMIDKYNYKIIISISFLFYVFGFTQRVKNIIFFDNWILDYLIKHLALLGYCQILFIIGAISYQQKWYSKFQNLFLNLNNKNYFLLAIIFLCIIFRCFVPSYSVAFITGFIFVFCFNGLTLRPFTEKIMIYISEQSRNIWFAHMFFYAYFFKEIIYAPKHPILIFIWLLSWCLVTSHLVNFIYNPILKWLNAKIK
ncbi:MAG: acyltransferase family protein [Flavobacterium sp.]